MQDLAEAWDLADVLLEATEWTEIEERADPSLPVGESVFPTLSTYKSKNEFIKSK